MNSKGFTIIELLVTIVVIGLVVTSASIGITHISKYKQERIFNDFKNELESNACLLVDLVKYNDELITADSKTLVECRGFKECYISTRFLVQEGFLKESLANPKTKETLANHQYIIKVTWNDGLKECNLIYE